MAAKNIAEVVIAGKVLKITGYESTEYLHQVAAYINDKISQFEEMEEYRKQPGDQKQILIYMNLADDFFKASRQAEQQKAELEKKEKEMYSLRHDLIESQMARENLEHTSREEREKLELEAKEKLESVKKSCKEKLEQQEAEHLEKLGQQEAKLREELGQKEAELKQKEAGLRGELEQEYEEKRRALEEEVRRELQQDYEAQQKGLRQSIQEELEQGYQERQASFEAGLREELDREYQEKQEAFEQICLERMEELEQDGGGRKAKEELERFKSASREEAESLRAQIRGLRHEIMQLEAENRSRGSRSNGNRSSYNN